MTTDQLADLMDLDPATVRRHLRGEHRPSLETVYRYAEVLNVDVLTLLPRLDSNQQPAGYGMAAA